MYRVQRLSGRYDNFSILQGHYFISPRSVPTLATRFILLHLRHPQASLSSGIRMQSSPLAGVQLLLLLLAMAMSGESFNITTILADNPDFSTFNHYLTATHLAGEINRRRTITVCAVDNAAMSDLLNKHPSIYTIKNVLSLQILLDYFDGKKLHQISNGTVLTTAMFQATGNAPGSSGFVNITDLEGGKVVLRPENSAQESRFVKSVKSMPFDISVIQISRLLTSSEAEAPTPAPSQMNLTDLMSNKGCGEFAKVLSDSDAEKTFIDNLESGLTVFCPIDGAFKAFLPKFNNLTVANKTKLLLYHGVPVYQSIAMLKSNNGVQNTLATDRGKKYNFNVQNDGEEVTLKTTIVTTKISGTLFDEQPDAIYSIDAVLLPKEQFKAEAASPAPAPAPEAEAPKPAKSVRSSPAPDADSPDLAPSDNPADQTADVNGAAGIGRVRRFVAAGICSSLMGLLLF